MHIWSESWSLKSPGSPNSINHPSLSGPSRPTCLHCVALAPDSNPARQVQAGLSGCCSIMYASTCSDKGQGNQASVVICNNLHSQSLRSA